MDQLQLLNAVQLIRRLEYNMYDRDRADYENKIDM